MLYPDIESIKWTAAITIQRPFLGRSLTPANEDGESRADALINQNPTIPWHLAHRREFRREACSKKRS